MNDEIKEILKTMKTFNGNLIVENTEVTTLCLTKKESKLLLDYITNLQQEIQKKDAYIKYLEEYNPKYYKGEKFYGDNREDYQQRIDKAIEYISSNCILSDEWEDIGFCQFIPRGSINYKPLSKKKVEYLLNILKGDSNE